MTLNRLLTDKDRDYYSKLIDKMFELCPEMMSRKISRANVQQAFMLEVVKLELEAKPGATILCVGSFEDTASECLKKHGIPVTDIDPITNNMYLHDFAKTSATYDIVFSTSVIEHVDDDTEFVQDMCKVLSAGGIGILTCDFNNDYKVGDKLPYSDVRFYTKKDFTRMKKILKDYGCKLVDKPDWSGNIDFNHDGCDYSFATFMFRKEQ
jgi:SAM-dependent methyltransferase